MRWPHAPAHWVFSPGIYMVTAGTYQKELLLRSNGHRDLVLNKLFELAGELGWTLRAWAVMANHYHFIAESPQDPKTLQTLIKRLHGGTAVELNRMDGIPGRQVWYQMWDSQITFEKSYLARIRYVNENPVRHGVTTSAREYRWCSAQWLADSASPAFLATVESFKIDQVNVPDEF